MISCAEAVRRLWEYLDDDLSKPAHQQVHAHIERCRRCCGEAEFTAALRDMLGRIPAPALPADVEQHLVGFLDALEQRAAP